MAALSTYTAKNITVVVIDQIEKEGDIVLGESPVSRWAAN